MNSPWNAPKPSVEVLATTGQRRVIRRPKVESHQHEERRETARCLTEREMEEKTPRQGGLDREVRVLPRRASRARSVRVPGGDGRRGQPDGDVASTDQSAIRGGPVLDVVLGLVRGMDSRLHPSSLVCPLATSLRIRAPTPPGPAGAHRINSGSLCRHLKIAGRIAFFMISSGYQPRRPKSQHNPFIISKVTGNPFSAISALACLQRVSSLAASRKSCPL